MRLNYFVFNLLVSLLKNAQGDNSAPGNNTESQSSSNQPNNAPTSPAIPTNSPPLTATTPTNSPPLTNNTASSSAVPSPNNASVITQQNITDIKNYLDSTNSTIESNKNHSNLSIGLLVFFLILVTLSSLGTLYYGNKKRRELELRLKKTEECIKKLTVSTEELKYDTILGMECDESVSSTEMGARQDE